jgi:hypothetical protein
MAETIITEEAQRIAGALDCLAQIRIIENVAENLPEEANGGAVYLGLQAKSGVDIAAAIGPMTPRQEGFIRTLGEYIHMTLAAGIPNLGSWTPVVAHTSVELQAAIEEMDAA